MCYVRVQGYKRVLRRARKVTMTCTNIQAEKASNKNTPQKKSGAHTHTKRERERREGEIKRQDCAQRKNAQKFKFFSII